jgi:endonuclease YncB( thermonuclease family)
MSHVSRLALGLAVLVALVVGVFIVLVMPMFGSASDNAVPSVAAVETSPSPAADAPSAAPEAAAPQPASLPVQPAPNPAPEPDQPPPPEAGGPLPLAPNQTLDPAEPGAGNVALAVNQTMEMDGTADARALPLADAPILARLHKGTPILVIGVLAGNLWLEVELPDQRAAYVPAAALPAALSPGTAPAVSPQAVTPPPESAPPPAVSSLPDTLDGPAKVVTTATLVVAGKKIQLFGVRGESGAYAAQLRALIESQGGALNCLRRDTTYVCNLRNGVDVARAALFNGAARATTDASADYQNQATAARTARRGVWNH